MDINNSLNDDTSNDVSNFSNEIEEKNILIRTIDNIDDSDNSENNFDEFDGVINNINNDIISDNDSNDSYDSSIAGVSNKSKVKFNANELIDKIMKKNLNIDNNRTMDKKELPIMEYSLKNIKLDNKMYLKTYFQEIVNSPIFNDLTTIQYKNLSEFMDVFNTYKNYQQAEYHFLQSIHTFGRNFYPSNKPIYDFKILTETFQLINEYMDDYGENVVSNIYLNSFINLLNYKKMTNNFDHDITTETLINNILTMFKMFLSLNSSKAIYNLLIFESKKFMELSNFELEEFMTPYDILHKVFSDSDTWLKFLDIVLKIKQQFENFIFDTHVLLSYEALYDFETYNKCATILYIIFKKLITLDICKDILRKHAETIEKFMSKNNIEKSKNTLNIIVIYFMSLLASSLKL